MDTTPVSFGLTTARARTQHNCLLEVEPTAVEDFCSNVGSSNSAQQIVTCVSGPTAP